MGPTGSDATLVYVVTGGLGLWQKQYRWDREAEIYEASKVAIDRIVLHMCGWSRRCCVPLYWKHSYAAAGTLVLATNKGLSAPDNIQNQDLICAVGI